MSLKDDEILIEKDDGNEEIHIILFTYENATRGKKYVFTYLEHTPEDVYIFSYDESSHSLEIVSDEKEFLEAEEILDAYLEDQEVERKDV